MRGQVRKVPSIIAKGRKSTTLCPNSVEYGLLGESPRPPQNLTEMEHGSFQQYLWSMNLFEEELSPKELEKFKETWQKKRVKDYQREYKKKHHRKELLFKKEEWNILSNAAQKHKMKESNFLKSCIFAYLNQCFILPDDEDVRSLEIALIRYGTNLNQVARMANTRGDVLSGEIEKVIKDYKELRAFVHESLRVPNTISQLLETELENNPHLLTHLETLILERKNREK